MSALDMLAGLASEAASGCPACIAVVLYLLAFVVIVPLSIVDMVRKGNQS